LILVREPALSAARSIVSSNLSFLLESRQRASEELARAEAREELEAVRRARMEEEDRRRAVAADAEDGVEAQEDEEEERGLDTDAEGRQEREARLESSTATAAGTPQLLGLPVPAASARGAGDVPLGSSVTSSIDTGIFKFELRSTADSEQLYTSTPHAAAPAAVDLHSSARVYAQKLDVPHGHGGDARAAGAVESAVSHPAPSVVPFATPAGPAAGLSSGLQQLHMEAEGDPADDDADGLRPRSGSASIDVHLSQLPFRLVLLTFAAEHLPHCTHAILHALMHSSAADANAAAACAASTAAASSAHATAPSAPSSPAFAPSSSLGGSAAIPSALRPCFFSFTQAGGDVSLIVESSCVDAFPAACVKQHRSVWRAIQVSQGSDAAGTAGASLVAPLSAILAQHGVSILYLSTASLDYILVAEHQVQQAIAALNRDMNVLIDA